MRRFVAIGAAVALVFAVAFVVAGDGSAVACNKGASAKNASASSCSKSAAAKTASASCNKGAATANASACNKGASAKTASSGACRKKGTEAAAASSASCSKSAAARTASASCSKGAAASTASACCSGKDAVAGYTKAEKKNACDEKTAARTAALRKIADDLPYKDNKRVVLTGSMQCGSCSYKATETCAPLLKTADGKVYAVIQNFKWKAMHKAGAESYKVSSRVTKRDGMKYLEVVAFKAL